MKPTTAKITTPVFFILAIVCMLGLVSWGQQFGNGHQPGQSIDTTPKNKTEKKIRDLDDVIEEMENADIKVDQEKFRRQFEESMKAFNGDQFKKQMEEAMKNLEISLKEFDGDKMKKQMEEAMKSMEISLKEFDGEKLKKQIESSMKELQLNMKELEKAKQELDRAKAEIKEYNEFISGLEKDGLLNRKSYAVSYKAGQLLIDGKQADKKTLNKYSEFLKTHEKFEISNKGEELKVEL